MKTNTDMIYEFLGIKEHRNERAFTIEALANLKYRIETQEGEYDELLNMKTLKPIKRTIAFHELHGENRLLRQVQNAADWLKKARKLLKTGIAEVRKQVIDAEWRDTPEKLKIRKAILALDDANFFEVYKESNWL